MKRQQITAKPDRAKPRLFDCCRCGIGRAMECLTCRRFARYGRTVEQRQRARRNT